MFRHTLRRFKTLTPGFDVVAGQWVNPSNRVAKFAKTSGIGFPDELRLVPRLRPNDYHVRISVSPKHVFSGYHVKYFNPNEHPLIEKFLYLYTQDHKTKPLWSYVHAAAFDGARSVVRTNSERMARKAFIHAMRALGYDSYGRALDGGRDDLYGTIRLQINDPKILLNAKFDSVVEVFKTSFTTHAIPRLKENTSPVRDFRGSRG